MLELKQISKRFGDKQILSDFNLLVPEKQIVAIVGPSGGGKTTLLRMLAGLETIDSGQIVYNGENLPLDALETRNLLGFVFQDFQLFPHLSVMENLILSPVNSMNVTKEEASKKAMSLLERLGLEHHADAYPFSVCQHHAPGKHHRAHPAGGSALHSLGVFGSGTKLYALCRR